MIKEQEYQRSITSICSTTTDIHLGILPDDLLSWLEQQIQAYTEIHLMYLLAHCENGVIWGKYHNNKLLLSSQAFPKLNPYLNLDWASLHQARLFGELGELLVWRGYDDHFQAVLRRDYEGTALECIDEDHLLWGDHIDTETIDLHNENKNVATALPQHSNVDDPKKHFMPIMEGSQGIVHAPPLGDATPTEGKRASLRVRHYLGEDDAGVVRICASRLVGIVKPGA